MKIAIVGCGNIANTHAQELTGMGAHHFCCNGNRHEAGRSICQNMGD